MKVGSGTIRTGRGSMTNSGIYKRRLTMSNREVSTETRTLHPRALAVLGEEWCLALLEVARDLRSGAIPPERYNQKEYCGTACCIAGHAARKRGVPVDILVDLEGTDPALFDYRGGLFGPHPVRPTPAQAADAIEAYVYAGADQPWGDC
jgi:hypothetical protein